MGEGGMMTAGAVQKEGTAEPQYVTAKTSVWWDIEICHVPKNCDPHAIAQNISSALVRMNYSGPVSISAYGDTNRIPQSVQNALSSTGIALNHVPAGIKDASDKKILVDMLFWAVDNPAPANYLLISGDRDFSNALHQLRMRRYNILLAQPLKASAALVAAAKSVWHWTSLVCGGLPRLSDEPSELANDNEVFNTENQSVNFAHLQSENLYLGNGRLFNSLGFADSKFKGKYAQKNPNQPHTTEASSTVVTIKENDKTNHSRIPESAPAKQIKKAPHEFFGASGPTNSVSMSTPNVIPNRYDPSQNGNRSSVENLQNKYHQPQPAFFFENLCPPISHYTQPRPTFDQENLLPSNFHKNDLPPYTQPRPTFDQENLLPSSFHNNTLPHVFSRLDAPKFSSVPQVKDIDKHSISEHPNHSKNSIDVNRNLGEEFKPQLKRYHNLADAPQTHLLFRDANPLYKHPFGPDLLPSSLSMACDSICTNGLGGLQGCELSEHVQSRIGVILLALNTLNFEKIMPTESNITDCIRYGDLKRCSIDVRKALDCAIEQQMIMKQNLGAVQLYVGRLEKLWKCVNPIGGNPNQYPKATWDGVQKFLCSSDGRSAIMSSECRYEAAMILRKACLEGLPLGEVLQILNMIITLKRWMAHPQSSWQPLTVTLPEAIIDPSSGISSLFNKELS